MAGGFSADAIGFYLQAEDQLSPTLATAATNYEKFVGQIEKWNRKLYDTATGSLGQLNALVDGWKQLPKQVSQGYAAALKALQSKIKPISQPLNLVLRAKDQKLLSRAIGQAVSKALAGASLRLGVSMPKRRLGYFDTSLSLRTLYSYLAQPPDMIGRLEPKRFAKGGVADGPEGVDKIPALLSKGELVLPKEIADDLLSAVSDWSTGGAPVGEVSDAVAEIQNLAKGLGKLKESIDAGLGSPADIQLYQKGVTTLSKKVHHLTDMAGNLSYQTRVRLAPAIKDATGQLQEFTEAGDKNMTVMERLLGKIIGPARFLAISKAADSLTETFSNLQSGVSGAFGQIEGDQTEGFIANLNQMNHVLRLSRDKLRELKKDAGAIAVLRDLNVNELSESLEGLIQVGVRDRDMLLSLGPLVSDFAASSSASADTAALSAYKLSDAYGFTEGNIAVVFENMARYSAKYAQDTEEVLGGMNERFATLGPELERLTGDQGAMLITSMSQIGAAMADTWAGSANLIQDLLAEALSGTERGIEAAGMVFQMSQGEIRDALLEGDPSSVLEGLSQRISALSSSGNMVGLEALKEALQFEGTLGQFKKIGSGFDDISAKIADMRDITLGPGGGAEAIESLNEGARAGRTMFQQFQTWIGQLTARELPLLDFSVAEVIDGINEFGPTSLLAIGMLAKMGATAVLTGGKFLRAGGKFLRLGKLFSKFGGWLSIGKGAAGAATTISSIGTAAGGASAAVGTGGFFASIAAGMTTLAGGIGTLGTILLSPPGIAFSVTLIAALLALAASARIATPALKVLGGVAETALGAVVKGFGLAVPLLQTFVETAGDVFLGTLDRVVTLFQELTKADPVNLIAMGPALLSTGAGIGVLSASVIGLGAAMGVAAVGAAAFRLASGGDKASMGVAGVIDAVVGDFALIASGPAMIQKAEDLVDQSVGFVGAYGRLLGAVRDLPGGGLLSGIFGDDPTEKLRKHASSIAQAVGDMRSEFGEALSLRQPAAAPAYTPAQIETVINAAAEAGLNDTVEDELRENNSLLRRILEAIMSGNDFTKAAPATAPAVSGGPTKTAGPLTRQIASFEY